ncbi:hypothetical protein [Cognatishimia sp.]|uniref:alginate O-acetyltransferase AlgX-related protein n=1 Tax=Cognatishimia sp. TaxID=2211648 RepID=UPI00351507E4
MRLRTLHITLIPFMFFSYAALVNIMLLFPNASGRAALDWTESSLRSSINQLYSDQPLHSNFAQAVLGAARYATLREGRVGVVVGPNGWLLSDEEFRPPLPPVQSQKLRGEILSLAQQLRNEGTQVIVLLLPTKAQSLRLGQNDDLLSEKNSLIRELHSAGVATLDAAPALTGPAHFFRTDTHWTPLGARSVADYLADTFPTLSGAAAVDKEAGASEAFAGDLIPFITTEAFAPLIGLPPEVASSPRVQISSAQTLDLFADPEAAHALVGTSYSANRRWGFEDALKLALSHDVLNFATVGQGPIAPMRAYLERAGRATSGVVIWEIPIRYLTDPNLVGSAS